MDASRSLTDMIRRAQSGDAAALKDVFEAAYQELRGLARSRLRKGAPHALLGTTALVHEAYLRFAQAGRLRLEDRQHFLKYASRVMRSVIVDLVRERISQRRGGAATHVTLNPELISSVGDGEREIMQVHDALEELAQRDARLVEVVEMRYFAGMTEDEISTVLGVTVRTVRRDWKKARLFLAESLK
jgi:RNA polymerase sigma factor (TIGR02999 family)